MITAILTGLLIFAVLAFAAFWLWRKAVAARLQSRAFERVYRGRLPLTVFA